MNIEDLKSLGIDSSTFKDEVIDRAVQVLLQKEQIDEEGAYFTNSSFTREIEKGIKEQVTEIVDQLIRDQVEERLKKELLSLAFQRTTSYGEPKGEKKTTREFIAEEIQTVLTGYVDTNGVPSLKGRSGAQSFLSYIVNKNLIPTIKRELSKHIDEFNKQYAEQFTERVGDIIKSVTPAIKP